MPSFGDGVFPDVAFYRGDPYLAWQVGLTIQVKNLTTDATWIVPLRPGALAFSRLGVIDDRLYLVWRDDVAYYCEVGNWPTLTTLGVAYGNDPVCIGAEYITWQDAANVYRLTPPNKFGQVVRTDVHPTGLSRILPDGTVRLVDEDRWTIATVTRPCWAGDLAVAEGATGGNPVFANNGTRLGTFWAGRESFTPRLATDGTRYVVATWGDRDVRVEVFTPDVIPANPVELLPITRPLWFGWFEYVPDMSLPGNCHLDVPTKLVIAKNTLKIIAQYVDAEADGNTPEAYARVIAVAKQRHPELPVIAYWPRPDVSKAVPPAEWVGVEAYWRVTETENDFERRIEGALRRCTQAVLIPQCYTSNADNTKDLAAIVPVINRLAARNANVVGVIIFSGSGRPTGLQDHPEVRPLWEQFAARIQTPVIKDTMNPPRITIKEYSPRSGTAPLRVRAVYATEPNSGPVDKLQWLIRRVGAPTWQLAALNVGDDPDHTYIIKEAGMWEIKLKAVGPGGEWETGAQRLVDVQPAVPVPTPAPVPEPAPEPAPVPVEPSPTQGKRYTFRSVPSGLFWTVDKTGQLALGPTPQEFEVLPLDVGVVAIKGPNGKFAAAEKGGGGSIRFRSDTVAGGWEQFILSVNANSVGFQAHDSGQFISARNEGQGPIEVVGAAFRSWEMFAPSSPLVFSTVKIAGRLRVEGRIFVNDDGIFRPRFASELTLCMHSDEDICARLDDDVRTNFNGIRVFCGAISWKGQTAEYARARLPFILEQARVRGLYVQVVALTDTKDGQHYDKQDHVRAVVSQLQNVENGLLEIANEYWHPSQDDQTHDLNYLLQLRKSIPNSIACALGAPEEDEPNPQAFAQLGDADFIVIHMDRGRDKWNMVRRVRELEMVSSNFYAPVINNEPIGAADNAIGGKRENDPAIFFTMGILNRIFEVGGCFHSDAGLQADPRSPQQQACAEAFVAGMTLVKTAARMTFKNAGWGDSPIASANFNGGVVRAYSGLAQDGSDNIVVLVGVTGDAGVRTQNGWQLGEVVAEMPGVRVHRLIR